MKPSLQFNLTQQLKITPQLQQAIRLLQLSTIDLRQEIQQQLETNPMLESSVEEEKEDPSFESRKENNEDLSDFQWSNLYTPSSPERPFNENEYIFENLHCTTTNLRDHLLWQLNLTSVSDTDKLIGSAIIDAINEDGFLTLSLDELVSSLSNQTPIIEKDEILAVQHLIQHFDPVGCGSHTLQETLLVQLEQLSRNHPLLKITEDIIKNNLQLLAHRNYRQLIKIYKVTEQELNEILEGIHQLNPKPGNVISSSTIEYAIPDLTVKKINNEWEVFLNQGALPTLSINNYYASLIKRAVNTTDVQFLKHNLQDARWFLKSIKSRQDTLLKVARYIVNYQKDFFDAGPEAMKPLILNNVASALEMHESTISRVTTQKFIHTPRGLFELKYFFSSHVSNHKGEECSSTAIRALIKKLIATEDPCKPFSDNKLTEKIAEKGIQIARRTVTKYREAMGIASSSERKVS